MELMRSRAARAGTLLCALALAACGDRGDPVSVTQPPASGGGGAVLASMECRVSVAAHTVACGEAALPAAVRGYVVVGGQNQLVKLTSSNIAYDTAGNHAFEFDVTVQNLIPQALATTDGTTADPNGVRVFFAQEPTVATGSGSASVSNADGVGTFTAAAQSFYQYVGTQLGADGILSNTETSSAKHWIFNVDPTVTTFTFKVYVAAEVRFPNGYVDVSTAPFVLAGGSQTITGITRSFAGTPTNQPITWGTSNPAVATVDASGNITAVAPGTAQITATAGSVSGTATIGVCPNLSVGGVYTATMPGAANVCLGGGAGGAAEYTYMPINLSTSGALSLTLTASGIQAVTGPPSPNLLPGTSARLGLSGAMSTSFDQVVDGGDVAILEKDAGKIGALMGSRSSRIAAGQTGNAARYYRTGSGSRRVLTAGTPAVGTLMDLNTNSSCSGTASVRTGMVRSVSPHMIIVADTMNPAGGFTTAQYDSIALEFDSIAWPVDTANFGAITDEDGNGHVVAFFTRAVNELSPPASSQVTLGFFASKDLFSNDPSTGCTNSNMGEMFYMLVPDPSGAVNSNVRTVSSFRTGSFNSVGTMGHEFQHMINAFRRAYVTNASALEVGWLNEGLSHIAEELMFYRMSKGLAPKQNLP
ncbi:MAG TPA: Ig-like domain-containing protein, partial [Longimicrobiaceae bacterium]|nr:Ig-like domain-containing protein [Longimicrobiaceae bacterium]